MTQTIRDGLPPVYRDILDDFLDRPVVAESRATCDDCAMCAPSDVTFLPSVKCCTFHPQLPNYLVGALFEDPAPEWDEGRRRLRARIASRSRVTPRWLAPSRKTRAIYRSARHEAFGRSETLLCPYYDDGHCTIWRYRESYCSTFFCKHIEGEDGRERWRSLRAYLDHVEQTLCSHLVAQVAPELVEPKALMTLEELEDRPPHPDDYQRWWGAWAGREEELYRECARTLSAMTRAEVGALVDGGARRHLRLLEAAHAEAAVPEQLLFSPRVKSTPIAGTDTVRVAGYSDYDPLVLPRAVFSALSQVTKPMPAGEITKMLAGDDDLLVELSRWRVLVAPADVSRNE